MIYWNSSAVVPLLVDEPPRDALLDLLRRVSGVIVWWGTPVESLSDIAPREREGALGAASEALERLRDLAGERHEVRATDTVRSSAQRMPPVHPRRVADCLQLAAAFVAAEHDPPTLEFLSLDDRLSEAASREGFRVICV